MQDANSVLNDQSNNDYQLTKELSVFIRNHKNKHLPIDKKYYQTILDIVMRNSSVDYSNVYFTDNPSPNGEFNQDSGNILFNIDKINKQAESLNKKFFNSVNERVNPVIIRYYYSLGLIIHEITHATQYGLLPTDKSNIYYSSYDICTNHNETYSKNHDLILFERYANLRGFSLAYKVLSYIYPEKDILYLKEHIYAYLLYGYKVNRGGIIKDIVYFYNLDDEETIQSPVDTHNAIMDSCSIDNVQIESDDDMPLYDKLYLGLPLEIEEYCALLNTYRYLLSQSGDIGQIIRKLQ